MKFKDIINELEVPFIICISDEKWDNKKVQLMVPINGDDYVGAFAGEGVVALYADNCYVTGVVRGDEYVGSFWGSDWLYDGEIKNSYSACSVSGNNYVASIASFRDGDRVISNNLVTGNQKTDSILKPYKAPKARKPIARGKRTMKCPCSPGDKIG